MFATFGQPTRTDIMNKIHEKYNQKSIYKDNQNYK